jgi:hypothetical protein
MPPNKSFEDIIRSKLLLNLPLRSQRFSALSQSLVAAVLLTFILAMTVILSNYPGMVKVKIGPEGIQFQISRDTQLK